jgi:hypothetical protein
LKSSLLPKCSVQAILLLVVDLQYARGRSCEETSWSLLGT